MQNEAMTEDRMQAQTDQTETFVWSKGHAKSSRLFPVDYTQVEFSKLMEQDKRSIIKKLLRHPYLSDILLGLLYSGTPSEESEKLDDNTLPIPVEAAPYLAAFYNLIMSPRYHKVFADFKYPPNPELSEDFMRDFSRTLYSTIKTDDPGNNYCRHVLCSDGLFSDCLLSSLWSEELTRRFDILRRTARGKDANAQAAVLTGLFQYIDQAIFLLANEPSIDVSTQDVKPVIQNQLTSLLSGRKKTNQGDKIASAEYEVENLTVNESTDLRQAFDRLESSSSGQDQNAGVKRKKKLSPAEREALRTDTRKAYLESLCAKVSIPEFERNYQKLDAYLAFRDNLPLANITPDKIERRCILTTRRYIKDYLRLTDKQMPELEDPSSTSHIGLFIDQMIIQQLNNRLSCFGNTAELVGSLFFVQDLIAKVEQRSDAETFRAAIDFINAGVSGGDTLPGNITGRLLPWLHNAWHFAFGETLPNFDPDTYQFFDPAPAAELLWQAGQDAAAYFNAVHPLPANSGDVAFVLDLCQRDFSSFQEYDILPRLVNECGSLVMLVFLIITKKVVTDTVPDLHRRIQKFIEVSSS